VRALVGRRRTRERRRAALGSGQAGPSAEGKMGCGERKERGEDAHCWAGVGREKGSEEWAAGLGCLLLFPLPLLF
jgi:hypothetical protein